LLSHQHGVVAKEQLRALGFSDAAIEHRLGIGRLHLVERGIYAVGRPNLTREGRWMAAVLACGSTACLSHASAAALWGFGRVSHGPIDVSVLVRSRSRRSTIRLRSRPSLKVSEITLRRGIPVTTPIQTLIDLATELSPSRLERAVNEADKLDLVDPESLRVALEDHAGEPGVRPLRELLDQLTFRLSDSELEVRFRRLAGAAGLPPPLTKHPLNGFEVDFYWPDLGLVVETDGFRYHRTASAQTRDALRDQTHTAAGLTTLRFSHHQVRHEGAHVIAVLKRTAARLETPAAA
jgi:very-short-patch-repair endonuclease